MLLTTAAELVTYISFVLPAISFIYLYRRKDMRIAKKIGWWLVSAIIAFGLAFIAREMAISTLDFV